MRVLILILSVFLSNLALADGFRIGLLKWMNTKHERDIIAGFTEGIKLSGLAHEFDSRSANGDLKQLHAIMDQWSAQNIDLVFTAGNAANWITARSNTKTPLVFVVTGDLGPDSMDSLQRKNNITGISHWISARHKLEIYKLALPTLKQLGVAYDPQNAQSSSEVQHMIEAAPRLGITVHSVHFSASDNLGGALDRLLDQGIDALWLPYERALFTEMDTLRQFTHKHQLPVFSSTLHSVEFLNDSQPFALAGFSVKYRELGRRAVYHAVNVLTGGLKPEQIPVQRHNGIIVSNLNNARTIGYTLPPLFLASSGHIITGFADQKITVAGTGDSQQLLRKLAQSLQHKLNGGKIEIPDSIGSTGGIKALVSGRVDLARTARPLREDEKNLDLKSLQFASSPVVFVVHPSVTGIDNLDTADIIDIYRGNIQNWMQLGGERNKIYAVVREPGDSSLVTIQRHITGFENIQEYNAKTFYNTPAAVEAMRNHRFTIGFAPLSAVRNTHLRVLKINGVYPSPENIINGNYPLVLPFSIVSKSETGVFEEAFIDYLFSDEGRSIITEFGAVPVDR